MEEKKLTEEELKLVKDLQINYNKILLEIGSNEVQQNDLKRIKGELLGKMDQLNIQEKDLVKNLQKKYGEGNIDIDTGVITPKS